MSEITPILSAPENVVFPEYRDTWDTECYNGIAIQFIVHVICGYVVAAFQTSRVNPVDVLLYTISVTEGHPHVSNFGNWIDVTTA